MARAFARIAFTPRVKDLQTRLGSREALRRLEEGDLGGAALGSREIAFIAARDSFYQGTVGEDGWPYVQHRGGPPGFLRVLDPQTLAYADFSGNRQYLSLGNLLGEPRTSLFLMDYPAQRRLKIWGRAEIIEAEYDPALLARLATPDYPAQPERAVLIRIEAFDWNCSRHITPRYTETEATARRDTLP